MDYEGVLIFKGIASYITSFTLSTAMHSTIMCNSYIVCSDIKAHIATCIAALLSCRDSPDLDMTAKAQEAELRTGSSYAYQLPIQNQQIMLAVISYSVT